MNKTPHEHLYECIGHLSIKFAHVEELLKELLVTLVRKDWHEDLAARMLVEDYNIARITEFIKKMPNDFDSKMEARVEAILAEIDRLRQERNFFIHGLWREPKINEVGQTQIICERKKVSYSKEPHSRTWRRNSYKVFTIDSINKTVNQLDRIIKELESILTTSLGCHI